MTFWDCEPVKGKDPFNDPFIVQNHSIAPDPMESFPFCFWFNEVFHLFFSFYGQKYLRSLRAFLVKLGTSRL